MAVYLSCSTDAFATARKNALAARQGLYRNVRRPLRGIQVKPNTYAVLRVLRASGKPIALFDSSSSKVVDGVGRSTAYANFIIQSLSEQRAEKQQVIETFGEDYCYFFGERPRFLEVSGVLINTADFNWKSEFWTNYDLYLRGSKLVEQNARLYFYFDDLVIEGYMLGARTSEDAGQRHMLPLNFQLYITNYAILSNVGSVYTPQSDVSVIDSGYAADDALEPILPSTTPAKLAGDTPAVGGLNAFIARTADLVNRAEFSIQSALETLRNTLYGRQLVVPEGIGTMAQSTKYSPPIENLGKFGKPPMHRPHHEMVDEYVERSPIDLDRTVAAASELEKRRINGLLYLQKPQQLEAEARRRFAAEGIDTGKPSAMMAILGRGAFAAAQYTAPFALKKIGGGKIGQAGQAAGVIL